MDSKSAESGTELVLDNRRLILAFLLLMAVCGGFFVIGFMEGKRQVIHSAAGGSPSAAPTTSEVPVATGTAAAAAPAKSARAEDRSIRDQLDWYKSVQSNAKDVGKGLDPAGTPKTTSVPGKKAAAVQSPTKPPAAPGAPAAAAKTVYTVQVGAFKQPREAETKAEALRVKGYPCSIELPKTADDFYLVKVGKFSSRADAVAMQRKLKKDGFNSFIKTY